MNDCRYGSAYFLTACAFQLFFGKLYTFFSIKWVFLIVLGIFELGSLICAVAPTSEALIIGRAIAGIGSSGVFTGALLIIAHSVPLAKRSLYTAAIASKCLRTRVVECRG
jgi:MFS family permease